MRQIEGRYRVKSPDLKPLHERALKLARGFEHFEIAHVPREKNREADRLVNAALDGETIEGRNSKIETRGEHSQSRADHIERAADRTIRARYRRGVLVPEESLDLPDGADVILTVRPVPPRKS